MKKLRFHRTMTEVWGLARFRIPQNVTRNVWRYTFIVNLKSISSEILKASEMRACLKHLFTTLKCYSVHTLGTDSLYVMHLWSGNNPCVCFPKKPEKSGPQINTTKVNLFRYTNLLPIQLEGFIMETHTKYLKIIWPAGKWCSTKLRRYAAKSI